MTNAVNRLCATKRSSQAIDAYATTKDTTVPIAVAPQPTVSEMLLDAFTACSPPAASSAGMPRKKLHRVAVTRSMPRNSPPEIVAPERETPGMSATHCHRPRIRASITVIDSSPRGVPLGADWTDARSANHRTTDHRMRACLLYTSK